MKIRRPHRATRSYVQTIEATPDQAFPLYCPVREVDWVPGWDPPLVISTSGAAELDCIFTTADGDSESTWVVTVHDPDALRVEMIKLTPGLTVCKLAIALKPLGNDRTSASISYSLTALSPRGERLVDAFTEEGYATFMLEWQAQMNHYLATGACLDAGANKEAAS